MNRNKYIAIEGNIGAGKTSLVEAIQARTEAKAYFETFENNPFLPDFYRTKGNNAFSLEMFFLSQRYLQLKTIPNEAGLYVSDHFIRKSLLFSKFNLDNHEFELFHHFYALVEKEVRKPDLILYLKRDEKSLLSNIANRGRGYEKWIEGSYLQRVTNAYEDYFSNQVEIPVLEIDADRVNFLDSEMLNLLITKVLNQDWNKGVQKLDL